VAFSSDGRTVAAAGLVSAGGRINTIVSLWDYTELNDFRADPTKQACVITGRGLTAEEWASYIPELPYQSTCPR
jgi:hypothetical protein